MRCFFYFFLLGMICFSSPRVQWDLRHHWKHVVDVCADGETLFYLNRYGTVYMRKNGETTPLELPEGVIQVEADSGFLYILDKQGNVWELHAKTVNLITDDLPVRQLLLRKEGLYMITRMGGLEIYLNGEIQKNSWDKNLEMMSGKDGDRVFFLDSWGRVLAFLPEKKTWISVDSSVDTVQISSGEDQLSLLKKNGQLFRFYQETFQPLKFEKKIRYVEYHKNDLYFLDEEGVLWELRGDVGSLLKAKTQAIGDWLKSTGSSLWILSKKGPLYEYHPPKIRNKEQKKFHRQWNTDDFYPSGQGGKSSWNGEFEKNSRKEN